MKSKDSIVKFMYFGHNYPNGFISNIWGGQMAKHLESKFSTMYERKGTLTFFSWFMELDNSNREILINWIEENYNN